MSASEAMAAAHQYIFAMEWRSDPDNKRAIAICSALTRAIHEEPTVAQLIQRVYTRAGQAAVAGIPDVYHDCDAMRCSSLEHIIARVPHTVDESPVRRSVTQETK